MPSVSHSEVDSWLLCGRKHYYGYGLSLQRVNTSASLATGSAIHKVLESFYATILAAGDDLALQQAAFDTALSKARETYEKIMADGFQQMDNRETLENILFTYYFPNEPLTKLGWRILAVEMEFKLRYDEENELDYPFVVDLICRDPEGKTVVVDHKAVWDFYNYEAAQLQPQIPKYIGALRALNHKIDYGAYNMLRTRKIKGTKGKDGTYPGPTLDQMLGWLPLTPNGVRVTQTFKEQIEAARQIQELKSLPIEQQEERALRVANKMVCQSCSFRDLCITDLIGGNTKLMIATEYTIRERKVFADVSEEAGDD